MVKLGAFLKKKRDEIGISIDDVERRTFISKRYLLAIENEDISNFPKVSYFFQLTRVYARFLGLKDYEIANLIKEFNPKISTKFILFGKNSLLYIILLLILFIITIFIINL